MDSLFILNDEARTPFLQTLAQALGCTYLSLWSSYPLPSNNRLFSVAGWWSHHESDQPSSSSSLCLARRLFETYRQTLHIVESGYVPGLAFKQGIPYMELKAPELFYRASTEIQKQFYQEAGIKTAVFAGCKSGEMEIGMSTTSHINMEMEMKKWFPAENWPSSSSSSLRSVSIESPEYSSLLLDINPYTSHIPESPIDHHQAIRPASISFQPHQQKMQPYVNQLLMPFSNMESNVDAVMVQAILSVISASSSSSSSSYQVQQGITNNSNINQERGAFKKYVSSLGHNVRVRTNPRRQGMFKRAVTFLRNINLRTMEDEAKGSRPANSQLHHKMSERKRREKLNESFQGLRSLLPPTSKKDKATLLSHTRDYLGTLKAEIYELKQKNQLLESRLLHAKGTSKGENDISLNERATIEITEASESLSKEREMLLRVTIRGACDIINLIIKILEFLKQVKDVSLVLMEADNQSSSFNQVLLRLKIKGCDWDKLAFKETMEKIVADVTQ